MSVSDFDAVNFVRPPEVGSVVVSGGQRYELISDEPHTRRDGSATTLLRWKSECAKCRTEFEFRTPLKQDWLNRRCAKCARPGRKA